MTCDRCFAVFLFFYRILWLVSDFKVNKYLDGDFLIVQSFYEFIDAVGEIYNNTNQ